MASNSNNQTGNGKRYNQLFKIKYDLQILNFLVRLEYDRFVKGMSYASVDVPTPLCFL